MPYERTRTVIRARKFLQLLASSEATPVPQVVRVEARRLLRHYPLDVDLDISAAALPGVWAAPEN